MQTLYYLIIYPIELILETVFSIANRAIENPGISIIAVSLVMNFMIMPMYKKADELQEKERDIQKRMDKWVTHINKTFHGDERFMMIQTYYRKIIINLSTPFAVLFPCFCRSPFSLPHIIFCLRWDS